ncbi:MAG: hypothetical protein JWM50_2144 [Microbacteriaceae bacterium]|jgi:hypothetical protein|nr:hypothetical protein [Microbacteriaceae bacterium]
MSMVTTAPGQLEIIAISDAEWRVSDPSRRQDDALCLVGFVQRVDDVFEVTLIGRPRERLYFASFDEATCFLGVSARDSRSPAQAPRRRTSTQGGA